MAELSPQLAVLKEKHKDNKQAFASAQMELFKTNGVNPAAGCLPAVVQIVLLFGLLDAMNKILTMNLNTTFLIWNMAKPDAFNLTGIPIAIPGLLVVMAAATQYVQTKLMILPGGASAKSGAGAPPSAKASEGQAKKGFMSEFAEAQSSMMWMFPLMFLFLGTQWPSGLALFWTVSSVLAIIQQVRITGFGPFESHIVKLRQYGKS